MFNCNLCHIEYTHQLADLAMHMKMAHDFKQPAPKKEKEREEVKSRENKQKKK